MYIDSIVARILLAILLAAPLTICILFLLSIIGIPVVAIIENIINKIKHK